MSADGERLREEFRQLASLPCPTGKQRHETKKQAKAQAGSLRVNRGGERTGVYLCSMCGYWHCGRR